MNSRPLLSDISPKLYQSAIMTSFSFDLSYFENVILRELRKRWISSVNLLVDQRQLDTLSDISLLALRSVGKEYSVNGVPAKGAFHPKINFFIGDKNLLVLFGSGNLTAGGHGKNHEMFAGFMANEKDVSQLPLIREIWNYLVKFTNSADGYAVQRIERDVFDCCPLLKNATAQPKHFFSKINDAVDVALLYNESDNSIFNQLSSLLPVDQIETITLASPFYDQDGSALLNLSDLFQNAKSLNVLIQEKCQLPPIDFHENGRINFYDFDKTSRGLCKIKKYSGCLFSQNLHAKVFCFYSNDYTYCLVGSANATISALGTKTISPINEEFCVLYKIDNTRKKNYVEEIGLYPLSKIEWELKDMVRENTTKNESSFSSNSHLRLKSADYDGVRLKVFIEPHPQEKIAIRGYDADGLSTKLFEVDSSQLALEFPVPIDIIKNILFCNIVDENGIVISNSQFINRIDRLYLTNPTRANRILNRIIGELEGGRINTCSIIDYLGSFYNDVYASTNELNEMDRIVSKNSPDIEKEQWHELEYNPNFSESNAKRLKGFANSNTLGQLIESIGKCLRRKSETLTELLIAEEENTTNADKEIKRQIAVFENSNGPKIKSARIEKSLNSLIKSYIKLLDACKSKISSEGGLICTDFDGKALILVLFVLTDICYFHRNDYCDTADREKNEYSSLVKEMIRKSLVLIRKYTYLTIKSKKRDISSNVARDTVCWSVFCAFLSQRIFDTQYYFHCIYNEFELCLANLFDFYGKVAGAEFQTFVMLISSDDYRLAQLATDFLKKMQQRIDERTGGKYYRKSSGFCNIYIQDRSTKTVVWE